MNKLFLGSVVFVALAVCHAAVAADMVAKAPAYNAPPAVVGSTWTGCYGGGNVGGGWGRDQLTNSTVDVAYNYSGIIGGVQAGCDYQINNWVIGARGMFDWSNMTGSFLTPNQPANPVKNIINLPRFGDAAVRLGVTAGSNTLLYGLGGLAWTHDDFINHALATDFGFPPGTVFFVGDTARAGWIAGVGAEWMFAPHWSLFAEYDYLGFGTKTVTIDSPVGFGAATFAMNQYFQTFMVGVNYRLRGPVVGR